MMARMMTSYFRISLAANMDSLPVELVNAIADELTSCGDISSFRLTRRSFSTIGLPLQAQHISVLDSFESLTRLAAFLELNPFFAQYTTRFTVYHAAWFCSSDTWEMRPALENIYVDEQHRNFITAEAHRHLHADATLIIRILRLLPRLRMLTVAPMPSWKMRRHEELSVNPLNQDSAGMTCSRIFPILRVFPLIQQLEVYGRVDPRELRWNNLEHIRKLHVQSLILSLSTQNSMPSFLQRFPGLQELHLGAAQGMQGKALFDGLALQDLQTVKLTNIWITSERFVALLTQHPSLHSITMEEATLSTGSWEKLLEITRKCYPHINLVVQNCCLNPYKYRTPRLYSY
ncbi:hypothetical protein F4678DRAFT_223080 [Xylaria arbuscula]|nr:hypothetical protein F4678DRAFT_223080 [Xylaria arbuscula]